MPEGTPTTTLTPRDDQELAAALRTVSAARRTTVISGGGTKLGWGRPAPVDVLIRTSKLDAITHRYGDLTATIGAGATLAAVNRELARHGQWLPIDSPFEGTTIGGMVATNDAGPLRHRFGTPRDRVLGATLALADGRLVKAGGTVVKNVAGYDLARLVSGSFGTLAALTSVTVKVEPLPAASGSLVVRLAGRDGLVERATALMDSPLELTALDLRATFTNTGGVSVLLLVRMASSPAATAAQLTAAKAMVAAEVDLVHEADEAELWRKQVRDPWVGSGAVVRLSWRPADLPHVLSLVHDAQQLANVPVVMTGRIGVGAGLVRIEGEAPAQLAVVEALRASPRVGHVVVLRADAAVREAIDVWGPLGDSVRVMAAIKRALDPAGILNAGRGPI